MTAPKRRRYRRFCAVVSMPTSGRRRGLLQGSFRPDSEHLRHPGHRPGGGRAAGWIAGALGAPLGIRLGGFQDPLRHTPHVPDDADPREDLEGVVGEVDLPPWCNRGTRRSHQVQCTRGIGRSGRRPVGARSSRAGQKPRRPPRTGPPGLRGDRGFRGSQASPLLSSVIAALNSWLRCSCSAYRVL